MAVPDDIIIFIDDIASVVENVTFTVDFSTLLVIAHVLVLQRFDFLGVFVAVKEAHDVLDLVFFTFVVEEFGDLSFLGELGFHQLYLAAVVHDVAIGINEPSCRVDWSQVLVDSVSVLVFEYYCLLAVVVIKVTEALMRVEIISLDPERERYLAVASSVNTDELVVLENDVVAVS